MGPAPPLRALQGQAGRLLSVRELAAALGVSTATVYRLCESGEFPHVGISNAIRVRPEDLEVVLRRAES